MSEQGLSFDMPEDLRNLTPEQAMKVIDYLATTKTTAQLRRLQDINQDHHRIGVHDSGSSCNERGWSNLQIMACIYAGAVYKREFGEEWDGGALALIKAQEAT